MDNITRENPISWHTTLSPSPEFAKNRALRWTSWEERAASERTEQSGEEAGVQGGGTNNGIRYWRKFLNRDAVVHRLWNHVLFTRWRLSNR